MRAQLLIAAALALATTITSASALTVVNKDHRSHAISVKPDEGRSHKLVILARHAGRFDCARGCELRLGTHKAHFDGKVRNIWIRDGKFISS